LRSRWTIFLTHGKQAMEEIRGITTRSTSVVGGRSVGVGPNQPGVHEVDRLEDGGDGVARLVLRVVCLLHHAVEQLAAWGRGTGQVSTIQVSAARVKGDHQHTRRRQGHTAAPKRTVHVLEDHVVHAALLEKILAIHDVSVRQLAQDGNLGPAQSHSTVRRTCVHQQ
jgi:hypothetical protein